MNPHHMMYDINNRDTWDDAFLDWSVADESLQISQGMRMQAQGIPRPVLQTSNSFEATAADARKKISDAITYGPGFCKLFEAYQLHLGREIDKTKHLMSLCTEHLVDYIKWARESEKQVDWISETLLQNDYLRPEVRNGIVMVLIYTFASIKATVLPESDMFLTLQDNDTGLGIANRFSLKIYNDPFYYLTFLKIAISSLIDAGVLPDNERLNQPKKSKSSNAFNQEEIQSFYAIQRILLDFLNKNEVNSAKNFVAHITTHWQLKGKFVRNRRFTSAWQSLQGIPLSAFATPPPSANVPGGLEGRLGSLPTNAPLPAFHTLHTQGGIGIGLGSGQGMGGGGGVAASDRGSERKGAISPSSSNSDGERMDTGAKGESEVGGSVSSLPSYNSNDVSKRKRVGSPTTAPSLQNASQLSISHSSHPHYPLASTNKHLSPPAHMPSNPFCALRFEKVGCGLWEVKETRWFDVDVFVESVGGGSGDGKSGWSSLLSSPDLTLCLVNETHLREELKVHRLVSKADAGGVMGRVSLLGELEARNSLITSWPRGEISQFQAMLKLFLSVQVKHPEFNLCDLWKMNNRGERSPEGEEVGAATPRSTGYIVYETVTMVGLIVRYEGEEMWCTLYPSELTPTLSALSPPTMLSFLLPLFPQLAPLMSKRGVDGASVVIRYFSHKCPTSSSAGAADSSHSGDSPLPPPPPMGMYQTLGTLFSPAAKVLERFSLQPHFHDLLLQAI